MNLRYGLPKAASVGSKTIWKRMYGCRYLYLFILPGMIWFVVFSYIPMGGLIIAFKDYSPGDGFLSCPWVGLKYFRDFFNNTFSLLIIRNTVVISLIKLIFGFPVPIIFALLLNEVRNHNYKKTIQTISYLPHFISWVVALGIIGKMLSIDNGIVNELLILIGLEPINFVAEPSAIWPLAYFSEIWKETGWNAIIYLAAISSIDMEQYEAAIVDGATRIQRIHHITLPGIRNTIMILLILATGNMFNVNFDQLYLLGTPPVLDVAEVIDTSVYRNNLQNAQYSLGTAVGMMKSIMNVLLVLLTNKISTRLTGESFL